MRKIYKNIFDGNVSTNGVPDGVEFRIRQISDKLTEYADKCRDEIASIQQKATIPCLLVIIKAVAFIIFIVCFSGTVQAWGQGNSLSRMYKNAPGIMWVEGISLVIWLVIFVYEKIRANRVINDADMDEIKCKFKMIDDRIRDEMEIPAEAVTVDILCQFYEIKNGKKHLIQPVSSGIYMCNPEIFVWRKENDLYFCDSSNLFRIPMECVGESELLKGPAVQISGWNKEEPINDKKFKPFKVYETNAGMFVKSHYLLHIKGAEEDFVIRIPDYDFHNVQRLLES